MQSKINMLNCTNRTLCSEPVTERQGPGPKSFTYLAQLVATPIPFKVNAAMVPSPLENLGGFYLGWGWVASQDYPYP